MRTALAAAFVLSALLLICHPAWAGERPWCSVTQVGGELLAENCSYWTLEECVPFVLAGNRGYCTRNPRWTGRDGAEKPRQAPPLAVFAGRGSRVAKHGGLWL